MLETSKAIHETVEGFKSLTKNLEVQRWQSNHSRLNSLLVGWKAMQPMMQRLERLSAPSYNVFYIMKNMWASEVKLHSPFLTDLFNVHGEHKQGALFYTELLSLLKLPSEIYLPADLYYFNAQTEVDSGSGGIDILLSYRNGSDSFAIAIENKIYAGDQQTQIARYHAYLRREFSGRFVLVYLTPDGRKPSDFSAPMDFAAQHTIPCLSYRKDIAKLLQDTLPHIQATHVQAVVEQYLAVCKEL